MTYKRLIPEITAHTFEELPHTLTVAEVAILCSVTTVAACGWCRDGVLRARMAGGIWLIEKSALIPLAKKKRIVFALKKPERTF